MLTKRAAQSIIEQIDQIIRTLRLVKSVLEPMVLDKSDRRSRDIHSLKELGIK